VACQADIDGDVLDMFCFVNKVGTQIPSQVGEEKRTHSAQDTAAVTHDGEEVLVATGSDPEPLTVECVRQPAT